MLLEGKSHLHKDYLLNHSSERSFCNWVMGPLDESDILHNCLDNDKEWTVRSPREVSVKGFNFI